MSPRSTYTIKISISHLALVAILILTAINGLFDAINVEYGGRHNSFLTNPKDRHADLLKSALSFPPYGGDLKIRRDEDRRYYKNNPYEGLEGVKRGDVTSLHVTPPILLSFLVLKRGVLWLGPLEIVCFFYATAFALLVLIALKFCAGFLETLSVLAVLALSYPFLMILCRGNHGALISTTFLIFFIRELLIGKRAIVSGLLLAFAFDCRPNVILLAPLFLILGWQNGLRGLLAFAAAACLVFGGSYFLATLFYPGYDFHVAKQALQNYYHLYVIDSLGAPFNNSAYGAAYRTIRSVRLPGLPIEDLLGMVQMALMLVTGFCIGVFTFLYLRRRLDQYEYAFALSALYILGSTIFATYHLFFLFAFILVLNIPSLALRPKNTQLCILAATVFMLAPKNYAFSKGVSFEVFLNPWALAIALVLIFSERDLSSTAGPFWRSLRWEGG